MQTDYDLTPSPPNPTRRVLWLLGGCLAVVACLICLTTTAVVSYLGWQAYQEQNTAAVTTPTRRPEIFFPTVTPTSVLAQVPSATPRPAEVLGSDAPPPSPTAAIITTSVPRFNLVVPPEIEQVPISPAAYADLNEMLTADYPPRDYFDLAQRLGHTAVGERTIAGQTHAVGDTFTFYVDGEPLPATLAVVTEHVYLWVENGITLDKTAVADAAQRFETDYYPHLVELFGTVWTPGMDNDPHFSLLHMIGSVDAAELGYFTDVNEYPTTIYSDSNQQEMLYLNMSQMDIGSDLYFGTLVHEVQHLIQWHMDANETAWLNEGLSQLAEIHVGLDTATTQEYLYHTDIRLNDWAYDDEDVDAHYAAAYLYLVYLWEQLGDTAVQELARHPANGMAAVNSVLQGYAPDRTLADFTADFAVANYVQDPSLDPRYGYQHLNFIRPSTELYLNDIPLDTTDTLNQFGVHYINLDFGGAVTIEFAGNTVANLLEAPPPQADTMWFAPPQNDTDAQLTAVLDLTGMNRATLRFNTWYDLEEQWDFAYLSISTDGGLTWTVLSPNHNQAGEYGSAWNGRSQDQNGNNAGWLKETFYLDDYTGREVMLRFEVVSDSAVTGRGFALSDLTIPELGDRPMVWTAAGFVETGWQIPQAWRVHFIQKGDDNTLPQVLSLTLDEFNQGRWPIDIGPNGGVLVIMPLTPFMDQPAMYWLNIGK